MKQLFLASTFFQVASLAAAIDSGALDRPAHPAGVLNRSGTDSAATVTERILLVSNHAQVIEESVPLYAQPSLAPALRRFDRVVDLNETLTPQQPTSWKPADDDLRLLEEVLRQRWELGTETVELVLESPQVNPAIALGRIFSSAYIRVHSDGLMSYGPTRNRIPLTNGQRMTALHHLPLVEGLTPRLLHEYGVAPQATPVEAFTAIVDEIADEYAEDLNTLLAGLTGSTTALALGQYLAPLGLLTDEGERDQHVEMVQIAARHGLETLAFKPHPAAPSMHLRAMEDAAKAAGVRLAILQSPVVAEAIVARLQPAIVIGSFSTALATARALYGIPIAVTGTGTLLETITPYQNSNRVPVTIMHELGQHDGGLSASTARELQDLVDTVSYCMQPTIVPDLRDRALAFLSSPQGPANAVHFKRRRLTKLDLPGALPASRRPRTVAARAARAAAAAARAYGRRWGLRTP